ncbi:Disintegrin and metalloproteinase domain-containing protein 12 [Biomphalaria glabrata]
MDLSFGYVAFYLFILLVTTWTSDGLRRKVRDIRDLKTKHRYNQILLDNIKQPYEIIYPQQLDHGRVSDISTRKHKLRHHGTHEHVPQLTIQIVMEGKKYRIKLIQNEALLSAGIVVKHYEENNQQVITKTVEHCYYHGHIKKDDWSSVAVSTCNGIRGVIHLHNETYVIQPLNKDDDAIEHPHVIFKASFSNNESCGNSQGLWSPFQELHKGELIKRTKFANAQKIHNQSGETKQKLLKIAMILDKSMYMGLEFSQQHVIQYAVDVANIVDLYFRFREIGFEVALTYLEFWNLRNMFPVVNSHRSLLNNFILFKNEKLQMDNVYDAAFFVTGLDLAGDKVGIAVPDSICSTRGVAVVKSGRPFEPQQTATILSHMAGHILGIKHDEETFWRAIYHEGGCSCKDEFGCIMSSSVLGAGGVHSRMFSNCSVSDLDVSLNMGIASCLWGAPKGLTEFKQTCGNNIIERGEECDCGNTEECQAKDPCCDPNTCLLQPWAQCRSGPCCSNCSFLSTTHLCRPRQSECDIPEFCDGHSGNCPFNTYIEDGHPCAEGTGYCIGGICPTVNVQCQGIWGADARSGHDQCFQRFNPTGNFNGHCGKDKSTGSYAKCQNDDILCGLLHCEGGSSSPKYGSDKGFSTTNVNANSIEYECKTVHGPALMDMPHMGMVQDGTKCGHNKICLKNACVQLQNIPNFFCPTDNASVICSNHGVCTPGDQCFCEHGWDGSDCSIKLNYSAVEKKSPLSHVSASSLGSTTTIEMKVAPLSEKESNKPEGSYLADLNTPATSPIAENNAGISTTLLIIILGTVVGGLFIAMGVTLICYRRRSPVKTVSNSSQKTEKKRRKKGWRSKKLRNDTEDESELSELPPPPIIVMDPDSVMPEKGILKNSTARLTALDHRNSSDSNGGSHDSVGPYMYDEDEDAEAEEICNIFREDSTENMDHLQESASFDFVIPPPPQPPPPQFPLPDYYPSPAMLRRPGQLEGHYDYENPYHQHIHLLPQQQIPTWRTALPPQTLSPPQSRIIKLRNLSELVQQLSNKATIDLSPSPDDPPTNQLSPSTCTSEDVRSSETETDKMFNRASHSDHSPTSVTSSSTQHTSGPSFGNLSQYLLRRNESITKGEPNEEENGMKRGYRPHVPDHRTARDQYLQNHNDLNIGYRQRILHKPHEDPASIDMPPPMNPINIRNIFTLGHTPGSTVSRDSNNTSHGSLNGDNCSFTGTGNSKNGYEKSSGYGSEQDHECFSIDGPSRSESHSRSESLSRSHSSSPPSYSAVIRTGPNRIQLVPAGHLIEDGREIEGIQQELNRLLENLPRINAGSFERSPLQSGATPSTPLTGPLPASRPLKDDSYDNGTPCIDRSLEEIPAHFSDKKSWSRKAKRPISVAVQGKADSNSNSSLDEVQSLILDGKSS